MNVETVDRDLEHLTYTMRAAALELVARCAERRVWLVILETLRSPERLAWLISQGRSWSSRSYHLAGKEDGQAAALDAAPILRVDGSTLQKINWNADHAHWHIYVEQALQLGLECGAEWRQKDWSHVQLQRRR
jgi:hypothetical protein